MVDRCQLLRILKVKTENRATGMVSLKARKTGNINGFPLFAYCSIVMDLGNSFPE
jgi:hypothetical protein